MKTGTSFDELRATLERIGAQWRSGSRPTDEPPCHSRPKVELPVNMTEREAELISALKAFVDFLEPMRFDRSSDDVRAAKLDLDGRALIAKFTGEPHDGTGISLASPQNPDR